MRRLGTLRLSRARTLAVSGLLLAILGVSAAAPEPALALCTSMGSCVEAAVKKFFGVEGDWISGTFIQWLIHIKSPGLTSDGVGAALYDVTRAFGFAALFAVMTLSVVHYWAAGVASPGAGAGIAIEGLLRTAGATLFILAWPWMIDSGIALTAILSDELVPGAKLDAINVALVAAGLGWNVVGAILILAYVLLGLILYLTKIMLTAGLLATAGGMPLALAVWPIPGMSVFAVGMLKWCLGIASVQIAWAVEIFAYAWIPSDWLTFSGEGHVLSKLFAPVTMIALMALMVMTPNIMLRLVGLSGGHFFAFVAARFAERGLSSFIPPPFGNRGSPGGGRQPGTSGANTAGAGRQPPPRLPRTSGAGAANSPSAAAGTPANGGPPNAGPSPNAGASPDGASDGSGAPPDGRSRETPISVLQGWWQSGGRGGATTGPYISADGLPHQGDETSFMARYRDVVQMRTNGIDQDGAPAASGSAGRSVGVGDVHGALNTLHPEGFGEHAASHIYGHAERRWDTHVAGRMADSAAGRDLPEPVARAFTTLGAAEHGVRLRGARTWSPPSSAPPPPPPPPPRTSAPQLGLRRPAPAPPTGRAPSGRPAPPP